MSTNIRLYELLREQIGQEAARMVSEAVPPSREIATRSDLSTFRSEMTSDFAAFRSEMRAEFERFRAEVEARFERIEHQMQELRLSVEAAVVRSENRILRWMLGLFVPVWLGVAAMVVTLLVKF